MAGQPVGCPKKKEREEKREKREEGGKEGVKWRAGGRPVV